MDIKLDENMPANLKTELERLGHDVDTSPEEGLRGSLDEDVWRATQHASRFFVTQDLDFSDIRKFAPGTHAGLLLVRLGEMGGTEMVRHLTNLFVNEDVKSWHGCFVVATELKLRVRRPMP